LSIEVLRERLFTCEKRLPTFLEARGKSLFSSLGFDYSRFGELIDITSDEGFRENNNFNNGSRTLLQY
jgi:hypothetical protein